MKRSLKNLTGYSLEGNDGTKGSVKDFLFDEDTWVIRYVDAEIAGLTERTRVLIPCFFLAKPDWQDKRIHVALNRREIQSCPDLDEKAPVSREYEKELNKHYRIEDYWPSVYAVPAGAAGFYPPRPVRVPNRAVNEKELNTSLRSFKEIRHYVFQAKEDRFGQLEDLILDDEDWQVVYLVVDTSRWKPWSKSVVLSVSWLDTISYQNRELAIDMESDHIKDAPEFNPSHPIGMDYEQALHNHYQSQIQ
jgi:hypothetical protein